MIVSKPREKTCKACKDRFVPSRPMQVACGPQCAIAYAQTTRQKKERQKATQDRAGARRRLDEMKGIPELIKEADKAFCAYIRARDEGRPCICCGRLSGGWSRGGEWDAGHYRSRGAASHIRYHEDNCNRQLKRCNRRSFDVASYRANLIERIGMERVEALENSNETHKWTREELRAITTKYVAKRKELEKAK